MDWYTYDVEVFQEDHVVVFKNKQTGEYSIFHNDGEGVKAFIRDDAIYCGFNTKSYDQYIIKAICSGFTALEVKEVNDFIIAGGNGWECPSLRGVRFWFNNVDIRDDMQKGLSLKAIEGHLHMDIRETEIDFDLPRALTADELERTIRYCKHDVDATEALTDIRKDYLTTKLNLGKRAGISPEKALAATNAKLTAMMLGAVRQDWTDGREYVYPAGLTLSDIPVDVLKFFDSIHDTTISDEKLFDTALDITIGGLPCRYAWGGVHGSLTQYSEESTAERVIQNRDVSSLYPSLIENYGYLSRNVPNPQLFYDIRRERIEAKHNGDKQLAKDLKLPLNTVSGAQENKYNDLYDPLPTRSLRISGQLFLTMLVTRLLGACKSIKLLNLNTDGIMYSVSRSEIPIVDRICAEWERQTRFELETDEISKVWIKDVNNLLILKDDGSVKTVGGYLNYGISVKGAWAINNNATIIKDAVREYFIHGTTPEDTINQCKDIFAFQLIAKAGSKYSRAYHSVGEKEVGTQKVNRVYATPKIEYGTLYKVKAGTDAIAKIENLPEHCIIDNDNQLTLADIDKAYYIATAYKRIADYIGEQTTQEVNQMATAKTQTIYDKLAAIRAEFAEQTIPQSGVNLHAEYKYWELSDIVPTADKITLDHKCLFLTTFVGNDARGTLINLDDTEQTIVFTIPLREIAEPAKFRMNETQARGAEVTYMRRYLYQLMLNMTVKDEIENEAATAPAAPTKPASANTRAEIKKAITNPANNADEMQLEALKTVLMQLLKADPSQAAMVTKIQNSTNGFTVASRETCEALIKTAKDLISKAEAANGMAGQ